MRPLSIAGLTDDGQRLVLQVPETDEGYAETFELPLADVRQAVDDAVRPERVEAPSAPAGEMPPPREVQQRIRSGETAQQIARSAGCDVRAVQRYEGPVLAEREHHAQAARRAEVDGRPVDELVEEHLSRTGGTTDEPVWDAWLVEPGRWEVRAVAGGQVVRLHWEPAARRVRGADQAGRQALRAAPLAEDALEAVLRPVLPPAPLAVAPAPPSHAPRKRTRASVPAWSEISDQVAGRRPDPEV